MSFLYSKELSIYHQDGNRFRRIKYNLSAKTANLKIERDRRSCQAYMPLALNKIALLLVT